MVLLYVRSVYPEPSAEWSSGTVLCCSYTKQHYSSYWENRKQYVCFNVTFSGFLPIACRVPQGSIIGPSLFLLHVNDLCNASTCLTFILFDDDTSCFIEGTDLSDMCIQLLTEMNKLSTWFDKQAISQMYQKQIA